MSNNNGQLETQELEALIGQVQEYQNKLNDNKIIMQNAANICDQAMGSDDISKKYIKKLNDAIKKLDEAIKTTVDVMKALSADLHNAEGVYND